MLQIYIFGASTIKNFWLRDCPDQEKNEDEFEAEASNDLKVGDLLQFDLDTVRLATSNFSDANKLGQGGFGTVYKVTNYTLFIETHAHIYHDIFIKFIYTKNCN
jgi:hypothetical protein